MTTSLWLDRTKNTVEADYIIVGAGLAGLSCAYWIKKSEPNSRVIVLEKNRVGFGASGRNAGFLTCGSIEHFKNLDKKFGLEKALKVWNFSEVNLQLVREHLVAGSDDELDHAHHGALSVATSNAELESLFAAAAKMQTLKMGVELLKEKDLRENHGLSGFEGGVRFLKDGTINPIKLLARLKDLSKADILEGIEVRGFDIKGDKTIVTTDNDSYSASKVYVATNAYLPLLLPEFQTRVSALRGQVLVTEPSPQMLKCSAYSGSQLSYFRQLPDGGVLVGGFRHLERETEVGYEDRITPKIQSALENFLRTHISWANKKVRYRWSGTMGFTNSELPMVGKHPQNPNLFILAGFSAHGMGLAFHSAKVLTEYRYGQPLPPFFETP